MTPFEHLAAHYDTLHRDKDYPGEARFVSTLLRERLPDARSILDFGCGTGRHAFEFARMGWSVTGIDLSAPMLAVAEAGRSCLPPETRDRVAFAQADMRARPAAHRTDAAVCLFAAINYNTTDEALASALRSARAGLPDGGLFVFDFWHAPGVLSQPPQPRALRVETAEHTLVRHAQPHHDASRRVVSVHYTLEVIDKAGAPPRTFEETHEVRYLFVEEIRQLARAAGFEFADSGEWPTRNPATPLTWNAWAALEAA